MSRTRHSTWLQLHALLGSMWLRKLWVGVLVVRALVLAPAPLAAESAATGATQSLSVEDVLIEGKLYSPQALFIVSRANENFGRDSVLPHYLQLGPSTRPLPYRLRQDVFEASLAALFSVVPDTVSASPASRRSP